MKNDVSKNVEKTLSSEEFLLNKILKNSFNNFLLLINLNHYTF